MAEQNLSHSDAMQHDLINNDVIHYDLANGGVQRDFASNDADHNALNQLDINQHSSSRGKKFTRRLSIIAGALLALIASASLIMFVVLPRVAMRERVVRFNIRAPHYNSQTDSKIPVLISGKTAAGKKISQHVYISPKAASVRLLPGQYTVHVEASPLLATGQLYRIPKSLKITTAQHRNPFSAPAPQVSDLTFSVKPAADVSEQDISRAQDYAHKSGYPTDKLKHNTLRLKRRTVASVYENVLDNLEASANLPAKFKAETEQQREQKYTLFDVTGDGTPELLVYGELAEDEFETYYAQDANNPNVSRFLHAWSYENGKLVDVKGNVPSGQRGLGFHGVHPSHAHNGVMQVADKGYQRWIIRNGEWARTDFYPGELSHRDPQVDVELEWQNYYDTHDHTLLEEYAMTPPKAQVGTLLADAPASGTAQKTLPQAKRDKIITVISDHAANGWVSMAGTIRLMDAQHTLDLRNKMGGGDSFYQEKVSDADRLAKAEKQYAVFEFDAPQSFAFIAEKQALTGVRLADVSERGSDRDPARLEKFNGKHVLVAFQSYYPAYAEDLLDNQVSGNIQDVTVLE